MNHWHRIMLACAMTLSLAGCGGSTNAGTPAEETKAETAVAETQAETQTETAETQTETAETIAPEGNYTCIGIEMNGYIIKGENLSGQKLELKEGGGGTLNFADNNKGPITSWAVDNGKFTMKAGVSDFTGTMEDGVLHLDIGEDTVMCFLKDGVSRPDLKPMTLEEAKEDMLNSAKTDNSQSYGGDAKIAGEYKVYAIESGGRCIRLPEGDTVFTFTLKEDGSGSVTVDEETENLLWKTEGDTFKLFETDGTPTSTKYDMTIRDGILKLVVPAEGDSAEVIEYFVRDGADVTSLNAADPE